MRRWWIFLGGGVLILVVLLAVAALNVNRLLDRNRDLLAGQVEGAIGRAVSFGGVGVSLAGGLVVRVSDLHVGDDPRYSDEDFVAAETVDVGVEIVPALLGRIEVTRVVLRSPSITVIQTAEGLSTDSLGAAPDAPPAAPSPDGVPEAAGEPSRETDAKAEPASAPALAIALIDVRDGSLRFVDRTTSPPTELRATHLDLDVSGVGRSEPVPFELSAALLGAERQNFRVSGSVGPLDAAAPRFDVRLRADPLSLDEVLRLAPVAKAAPADLSASGPVRLDVEAAGVADEIRFEVALEGRDATLRYGGAIDKAPGAPFTLSVRGAKTGRDLRLDPIALQLGDTALEGRADVKNLDDPSVEFSVSSSSLAFGAGGDVLREVELDGNAALPAAGPRVKATLRSASGALSGAPYQALSLALGMAGSRTDIEKLSLGAYGGTLETQGFYDAGDPAPPRFDLKTRLESMRMVDLLASQAPGSAGFMTGSLGGSLDIRGAGADWKQIEPGLAGDGSIGIRDGVIRKFNPAGDTLRAVMALPMISGHKLGRVLADHPEVFGAVDTPFQRLDARFAIRGRQVHVQDLALVTPSYVLAGKGRYGFDNRADFQTALIFSPELSQELVAARKEFRYMRTRDRRVSLPVAVHGSPPKLAVTPDLTAIVEAASREALGSALDKALGVEEPEPGAPPADPDQPAKQPSSKDIGRDLLRRGIEDLLGGGGQDPSKP